MMALDSTQFVVRRCSAFLLLMMMPAAMSWVAPAYADAPDGTTTVESVPFHYIPNADLDDFRGGTLTWEPDAVITRGANFTLKACWTRSDFPGGSDPDGFPAVGDIIFNTTGTRLFFGDGSRFDQHTAALFFKVTGVDKASDVIETVALRPGSSTDTTIPHIYTNCNRGCG